MKDTEKLFSLASLTSLLFGGVWLWAFFLFTTFHIPHIKVACFQNFMKIHNSFYIYSRVGGRLNYNCEEYTFSGQARLLEIFRMKLTTTKVKSCSEAIKKITKEKCWEICVCLPAFYLSIGGISGQVKWVSFFSDKKHKEIFPSKVLLQENEKKISTIMVSSFSSCLCVKVKEAAAWWDFWLMLSHKRMATRE